MVWRNVISSLPVIFSVAAIFRHATRHTCTRYICSVWYCRAADSLVGRLWICSLIVPSTFQPRHPPRDYHRGLHLATRETFRDAEDACVILEQGRILHASIMVFHTQTRDTAQIRTCTQRVAACQQCQHDQRWGRTTLYLDCSRIRLNKLLLVWNVSCIESGPRYCFKHPVRRQASRISSEINGSLLLQHELQTELCSLPLRQFRSVFRDTQMHLVPRTNDQVSGEHTLNQIVSLNLL